MNLSLINGTNGRRIRFTPRQMLLAGYTGRDRAAVQRHIDELAEQGIPHPPEVPAIYPGAEMQVDSELSAGRGWSSGEIEFVLLVTRGGTLVGVGSDHTDRELERTDMIPAKQAFPKILGRVVWPLDSLVERWDRLMLRSWLSQDGERELYQEGPLAAVMRPDDLLALVEPVSRGLVLYSGTVPALRPAPRSGRWLFTGALLDVDGHELSRCKYAYEAAPNR